MKMVSLIWMLCLAGCVSLFAATPAPRKFLYPPNVIFILADDLGYMDIAPNNPKTFYETPNLERLAAEGMRFTAAYAAAPVCSPTRASILTGKHPARLHLTNFIKGTKSGKFLPADTLDYLPVQESTLAEDFAREGYFTGLIGKWHLGGAGYLPEAQGFEVNIAGSVAGSPSTYFSPYNLAKLADGPKGEFLTTRLADEALRFVADHARHPFFLYWAPYAVHIPLQAPRPLVAKYEEKAATLPTLPGAKFAPEGESQSRQIQDHPTYAAMVQTLDEGVGRLLSQLEELGLAKGTIVVFYSDNGGLSTAEGSPTSNSPLRAGKGWLYEGGIRVPLLVWWPGSIQPGVSDYPVTSSDFLPTLLELVGAALPPIRQVDGKSFAGVLRGQVAPPPRPLFWHFPHYSNQGGFPASAVRLGDWKLIRSLKDKTVELFNLKDDPEERKNRAEDMPDKVSELAGLLDVFLKDTDAAMLKSKTEENPSEAKTPPKGPVPVKIL